MPAGGQWKRYTEPRSAMDKPAARGRHGGASLLNSSPRVRGTRESGRRRHVVRRFIPAPAGNAPDNCMSVANISVHPRACGERDRFSPPYTRRAGSSPRLRGTRRSAADRTACVPVHPRACGERTRATSPIAASVGSSPRLRGTHDCRGSRFSGCRFIPAPAGNAFFAVKRCEKLTVHPRACGERSPPL